MGAAEAKTVKNASSPAAVKAEDGFIANEAARRAQW